MQHWAYVFIRSDIPTAHQAVQASHAIYEMSRNTDYDGQHPSFVFLEVDDINSTLERFKEFKTYPFYEPYADWGLTAFALDPVGQEQRGIFKEFKLWRKA